MRQVLLVLISISIIYSQQDMITSNPFPHWDNSVDILLKEVDENNKHISANKNFDTCIALRTALIKNKKQFLIKLKLFYQYFLN